MSEVLWSPPADAAHSTQIGRWMTWLEAERDLHFDGYHALWEWSVTDLDGFWSSIWEYFGLLGDGSFTPVLAERSLPGARWCPEWRTNWAENVLRRLGDGDIVVARSQTRDASSFTAEELAAQVARARTGLKRSGIRSGDRVAAYLPNIPEALILLLAAASLGAVFSSCPPEFGVKAVIDRFGQVRPRVLFAVDGYRHRGRPVDKRSEVAEIRSAVPSIEKLVVLPYLGAGGVEGADDWTDFLAGPAEPLAFERLAFDHPLFILYSSGTTGRPKPIVHGHGGVLLEQVKANHLHHDLGPGDRFFWYSTTGWVMWNYLVSGLLTGASVVLFDGDSSYPDMDVLWDLAADSGVTVFGVSAPYLLSCRRAGLRPRDAHDLHRIRQVGSTGAPLTADGFRWIYDAVGDDPMVVSASGGTDVCGAFVSGVPTLPVVAGEITCRCLGAKVESFDDTGHPVIGREGELVITEPLPSMPVYLWGDDDGSRYRASYFERFPGVWAHGDWITITDRGTCLISGRSDATLNRGGVRLGTSDFYDLVERRPEVADSLVVHIEDDEGGVGQLILFVQPADGHTVDGDLTEGIRRQLRTELSPRHVPDRIVGVSAVPRTLTGKKLEVPVKKILRGHPAEDVVSPASLVDPKALDAFTAFADDDTFGTRRVRLS
ncbi:MAG TPA: acetoacetate--CoA ligase [Acidimicrobiales bacterium]|jgi:acetoacetyl-CoA synthetase|nr:acetoacetate--CoA ligase [Acidimicrobiales bacterium]